MGVSAFIELLICDLLMTLFKHQLMLSCLNHSFLFSLENTVKLLFVKGSLFLLELAVQVFAWFSYSRKQVHNIVIFENISGLFNVHLFLLFVQVLNCLVHLYVLPNCLFNFGLSFFSLLVLIVFSNAIPFRLFFESVLLN